MDGEKRTFEVHFDFAPKACEGVHDKWPLLEDTRVVDKNTRQ
jgi:hypothetical protein